MPPSFAERFLRFASSLLLAIPIAFIPVPAARAADAEAGAASRAAAGGPRLALYITEPIGNTPGHQCVLSAATVMGLRIPQGAPTVTEKDVTAWDAKAALWTLDPERFRSLEAAMRLQDRCFVLVIDRKVISSGLALASMSARLTDIDILGIHYLGSGGGIDLKLTTGNRGGMQRPIHLQELDAVLGPR